MPWGDKKDVPSFWWREHLECKRETADRRKEEEEVEIRHPARKYTPRPTTYYSVPYVSSPSSLIPGGKGRKNMFPFWEGILKRE